MLTILHTDQPATPTQAYAHTCWQNNPHISPSYWHHLADETVGKAALDWRTRITTPAHLSEGCNLVLLSPATAQAAAAIFATLPDEIRQALILLWVTPAPQQPAPFPVHAVIWQVQGLTTPAQRTHVLTGLEEQVKQGTLSAYGIADAFLTAPDTLTPLSRWLEDAVTAAQSVYQRRKRPALRVLVAEVDLLNLTLLTTANSQHAEETVSALEHATRLGLGVVGIPAATPLPQEPPAPQALAALQHLAQAENALSEALGGWPSLQGQLLFNVLTPLSQGQAPWPTPQAWQQWQLILQPFIEEQLTTLLPHNPVATATFAAYQAAVQQCVPFGPALANAACQPLVAEILAYLRPKLPSSWQNLPASTLATALISSLPGLSALAISPEINLQDIQKQGDLPNPAILFT